MSSLAVLGAFLLGIGPGAPVQPCPKHRGMHGGHAAAPAALSGSHAEDDVGRADGHGDHRGAEHSGSTGQTHSHSDGPSHPEGPCDCLANCLTCCGPAVVGSSPDGILSTLANGAIRLAPLRSVTVADPAAHLRPLGRSPPA